MYVEYLDIKGKKYPFRISYYVQRRVQEETGHEWSTLWTKDEKTDTNIFESDPKVQEVIFYAGLEAGAFAVDEELDLKKEQVPLLLDICYMQFIVAFPKFFKYLSEEVTSAGDAIREEMKGFEGAEKPEKSKQGKQ